MIDRDLLALIGGQRKYIYLTVLYNVLGLIGNLCITAGICWLLATLIEGDVLWTWPLILAAAGIVIRYIFSNLASDYKIRLGNSAKTDLRHRAYEKILRLGVRSTEEMSMAGLTQVTMEGIEQLNLYYSTYLPHFFYAMIARCCCSSSPSSSTGERRWSCWCACR